MHIISERPWMAGVIWSAVLVEPMLSASDREQREAALAQQVLDNPNWASIFFAGIVSDLGLTLPRIDPWHRVTITDGAATLGGARFGDPSDHEDLIPPLGLLGFDLGSAAIMYPISDPAAIVVASALRGRDEALTAIRSLEPEDRFVTCIDAIRWLAVRRRCYRGFIDTWVVDSAWWWAEQAHRLLAGDVHEPMLWDLSDTRLSAEAIGNSEYRPH